MPQKKDKRKIFWVLFLLFLITGSLLYINYGIVNKRAAGSREKNISLTLTNNTTGASNTITGKTDTASVLSQNTGQPAYSNSSYKKSIQNKKTKINNARVSKSSIPYKDSENKDETTRQAASLQRNNQPEQQKDSVTAEATKKDKLPISINQPEGNDVNNLLTKEIGKSNPDKKTNTLKKRNKFINSFGLNLSSGMDVSAVKLANIGKISMSYGAGISYQLNKKLTLRTGLYIEKKIYDANVSDYHPPVRFWNYYPDLKHIDADCKVYEAPLIINYSFAQTQRHQWFGAIGFSSYFMKKEDYNFLSKNPSGQTSYDSYTINNKNQHYLSSIRLSAGYERKLSNSISILAEPYFNLPLSGVGYGKVKLYSTGILFTLSLKPFSSKE